MEDGDSVDAASLPDDVPEPDDQSLLSSVLDWIEANVRIFAAGILAISVILLVVFIIWIRKTSPK